MDNSTLCQHCFIGHTTAPPSGHTAYVECTTCRALTLTYEPQDYQAQIHEVPVSFNKTDGSPQPQIIFVAGGYGSGKSRASLQEFFLRALENPKGTGLILAPTLQQLKRTSIKTLFQEIIPPELITRYNKTDMEIELVNGFVIYAIPADDEEKIRSINAGLVHIEEASGVDKSIYVQLLTRMRDPFTHIKTMFVCTNPSGNWVRDTFAQNPDRQNPSHPEHKDYNPFIHVFIWPTALNQFLPVNFIELISTGRPDWWRRKFLEGSFEHNEGAVYPNFAQTVIDPFPTDPNDRTIDRFGIPKRWERFVALDHGLRNPTAVLFGAINPDEGEIIIYDEYYEPNRLVPDHAKHLTPAIDEIPAGTLRFMVADPSIRNKTDPVNGKSVLALYQEYGLFFQPGNNSIETGILRVNSYIERNKLKVYSTCVNLRKEGINYAFPEVDIDDDKNLDEKPVKKADHACDALRYALMRLPDDPDLLKTVAYVPPNRYTTTNEDEDDDFYSDETYSNKDYLAYV